MKLYATVTSERASKGQGGNKYLEIEIIDEERLPLLSLYLTPELEVQYIKSAVIKGFREVVGFNIKQECTECGKIAYLSAVKTCPDCVKKWVKSYSDSHKQTKGEKQKSEVCYCDECELSSPHYSSDCKKHH